MPKLNKEQKEALKNYGLSVRKGKELLKEFDKITLGEVKKDDDLQLIFDEAIKEMTSITKGQEKFKQSEKEATELFKEIVEHKRLVGLVNSYTTGKINVFTIPWLNYCGAGTFVEKNIVENVEPVNRVDAVCRQHDIDYANTKTIEGIRKADEKAVKALKEINNPVGTEIIDGMAVSSGLTGKMKLEDFGVLSSFSFNKKLSEKETKDTKELMDDVLLKLKGSISGTSSPNPFKAQVGGVGVSPAMSKISGENISVEDIEPKKMSGGLSKIEAVQLGAKYNQLIKDGATIDKFDMLILELLFSQNKITANDLNELAKNQNKFVKTMKSKKGAPKANKKNFGVKLTIPGKEKLERMKSIQQPFVQRLGLSEVKGSVPSSSESPSDEDPSGESSEGPSLSSRNPQSFAGQARIKHTTTKPKVSFLEDIGLSIRKALTSNKKTFPDFGKLQDMFPENIRMRKQTGKLSDTELKNFIDLGYAILDAVEDGFTEEVPQLIQEFNDQFVVAEKKTAKAPEPPKAPEPVVPPEVKEAKKAPIKIKVKKAKVTKPQTLKNRIAGKADSLKDEVKNIFQSGDGSKQELASIVFKRLEAIADVIENSDYTDDTLNDVNDLLDRIGKDLTTFGITGDLIPELKNIELDLGLTPPVQEEAKRRVGPGGEFKEEPVVVPAPPAISQQVQREAPNRPVEKLALNTGTATDDNTAPRDRRPMFFHFGTDLITETPEQQEEDIDVFANFSWVPKDGNFYNEDKNQIVKCNKRNENIRFNNGLWRPAIPKRKERIEESSSLHKKLQLLLAPIIQLEQVRLPIGTRANPSLTKRIQMDTRQFYGVSSSVQRNSIKNRNIFPNVVDSLRV